MLVTLVESRLMDIWEGFYRILKFSEQYTMWFKLAPTLEALKENFKIYLAAHSFVANEPTKKRKKISQTC